MNNVSHKIERVMLDSLIFSEFGNPFNRISSFFHKRLDKSIYYKLSASTSGLETQMVNMLSVRLEN